MILVFVTNLLQQQIAEDEHQQFMVILLKFYNLYIILFILDSYDR